MSKILSEPLKLGSLTLKNRVVMAAMTRMRTDPKDGIPNDLLVEYYSQRAGAGLILTECASVSKRGEGFPGAGNIYTKEQAEGWSRVVKAVHEKGSVIFIQIFHAGRSSHPFITGGLDLWAPSAVAIPGRIPGQQIDYATPKEITLDEIKELKEQFLHSFKLAKEAGFDGIQLHGANGYIIDEFLRSHSNRRTDSYGQSPEGRCRLALELVDLACSVFDKDRVSIKLSPVGRYGDMFDADPKATYGYLLKELDKRQIGSVELMRPDGEKDRYSGHPTGLDQFPDAVSFFREHFKGVLIGNQGYVPETAEKDVAGKLVDMVSFAKYYIVNPDLFERIANGWPIETTQDMSKWFGGNGDGYITPSRYAPKI